MLKINNKFSRLEFLQYNSCISCFFISYNIILVKWIYSPNSIEHNPLDCVRLSSASEHNLIDWDQFRSICSIGSEIEQSVRLEMIWFDCRTRLISMSERSIDYTGGCLSFTQNFRTFGQNVMDDDWFWLDLFFIIIYDYFAYNTNNNNGLTISEWTYCHLGMMSSKLVLVTCAVVKLSKW